MLIRTSGTVQPNLYLLTLGHTCRYAIGTKRVTLTDPGAGAHTPLLIERLCSLGLPLAAVEQVVLTNLQADRIGALPALRSHLPNLKLIVTSAQAVFLRSSDRLRTMFDEHLELEKLGRTNSETTQPPITFEVFSEALRPDRVVADSEVLECEDGLRIRIIPLPGCTQESIGFIVEPHGYLIGDEVLGYYRGRDLAAPGGNDSIDVSLSTLKKLETLPIIGLCLPNTGVLTGELVRKHLQAVVLNTTDLVREVKTALESGIAKEVILRSIEEAFYLSESRDPFVLRRLHTTFNAVARSLQVF